MSDLPVNNYNIAPDKATVTHRVGEVETIVGLNMPDVTVYDVMAVVRAVRDGRYDKKAPGYTTTSEQMPYLRR